MTTAPITTREYQAVLVPRRPLPDGSCLLRFAVVGAVGYGVNVAVFDALTRVAALPYLAAATTAFAAAVANNYALNRAWTFRSRRGSVLAQGSRFTVVSLAGLLVDLVVLRALVGAGVPATAAQAAAVLAAVPVTFLGSKLWSFRTGNEIATEEVCVLPPETASAVGAVVCLPTYDERANLRPMVEAVLEVLRPNDVVLVIDDDSPDGTGEAADELALRHPNVAVMHRRGKSGLGCAYLDGFRYALDLGAELVVQMDCDLSHDPCDVPRLIAAAQTADVAIGSRYVEGGRADGLSGARKLLSRVGSTYARALLGLDVRDLTGGFKCHRRSALEGVDLGRVSSSGYGFQIETTFRQVQAGATVAEVPITFRERAEGVSKLSGSIALEAMLKVPELRLVALGAAAARYGWVIRWWVISRALVLGAALAAQAAAWPRPSWYPSLRREPLALLGAWDGRWYSIVAERGYLEIPGRQSDTAFFPLYPIVLRALHPLGLSYLAAGIVVANAAFLVALVALYELSRSWMGEDGARRAVVYAALFPFGFIFSMVYPESLVLAAMALAGLFAVRGRWTACAAAAAVAALTRPEGLFVALPVLVIVAQRWRALGPTVRGRAVTAAAAAPAAMLAIALYERHTVGDALAFSHAQLAWGRWTSIDGVVRAGRELWAADVLGREWLYRDAAFCALYLLLLLLARRARVPWSWIVMGALLVLLPLSSGSFTSDARFGLLAVPVYCGLAHLARLRRVDAALRVASGSLLALGSATILLHWP